MNDYFIAMAVCVFALGAYLTYLINKVSYLEEQLEMYNETMVTMAQELQSLGSPNVKVVVKDSDEE